MLETQTNPGAVNVSRLLAGAAKTIAKRAQLLARDRERGRRP